uniref:Uncharacterized protein n=1 Tax=Anguilla anguilla TaxID=7936 RepID=A0A0E9R277_ANGAN
MGGEYLAD